MANARVEKWETNFHSQFPRLCFYNLFAAQVTGNFWVFCYVKIVVKLLLHWWPSSHPPPNMWVSTFLLLSLVGLPSGQRCSPFGSRSDCAHTKQHFHLHLVKLLKSHLYIFIVQCLFWVGYSRLLQLLLYLIYLNARGVTSCYVTTLVLPDSRSGIQSRKLFCNRLHSQCRAVCAPNHCGLHRLYCVVLLTEKKFMFPVICDQCTQ